jgi:hypothetical protein
VYIVEGLHLRMSVPALRRLRQQEYEFKASLGHTARPSQNKNRTNKGLVEGLK